MGLDPAAEVSEGEQGTRGQSPEPRTLCADGLRGPSPSPSPLDTCSATSTSCQRRPNRGSSSSFVLFFSHLQPAGKTPQPRAGPSTCSQRAGSQARTEEEAACACPGAPGTGWIPPVGSGPCAHPASPACRGREGQAAAQRSWAPGRRQRPDTQPIGKEWGLRGWGRVGKDGVLSTEGRA